MAAPRFDIARRLETGLWRETDDLLAVRHGLREPLKAVLSVLLATFVASAMHLPDVVWAALSGFLVMRGSLADSLARAAERVLGTIAGGLLGLLLARWAAQDIGLLMLVLFAVVWIAVYQGSVSAGRYAWLLFGVTATLVLADALGTPVQAPAFAAARAAQVAIGSLSALVVTALFKAFGAPLGQGASSTAISGATLG